VFGTDWKKNRVFLHDPDGRWESEVRLVVECATGKRPKICGQPGRQYIVAPGPPELAVAVRKLYAALLKYAARTK